MLLISSVLKVRKQALFHVIKITLFLKLYLLDIIFFDAVIQQLSPHENPERQVCVAIFISKADEAQ